MALTQPRPTFPPAPGKWTYDDLLALPEDGRRGEIIEGTLIQLPPVPGVEGATKVTLAMFLHKAVAARGGTMVISPLWVFLPGAGPIQPDVFVILLGGLGQPSDRGLEGPPDLVVELVSTASRCHDLLTKRVLYARSGVLEYWLVEPDARSIDVLVLDGEGYRSAQHATGTDVARSVLMPEVAVPLADLFQGWGYDEGLPSDA